MIIRLGRGKRERGVLVFLQGVFSGDQERVFSYLPDNTSEKLEEVKEMLSLVECGKKSGADMAEENMQKLIGRLLADKRNDDLLRVSKDKDYLKKMYKEYGIGQDD